MPTGGPPRGGTVKLGSIIDSLLSRAHAVDSKLEDADIASFVRSAWNKMEKQGKSDREIASFMSRLFVAPDGYVYIGKGNNEVDIANVKGTPEDVTKGGGEGGETTGTWDPNAIITDAAGTVGYDLDGDGFVDNPVSDEGGEDTYSTRDYLSQIVGQYSLTPELRDLARRAAREQWSIGEWTMAVTKTDSYRNREALNYKGLLTELGFDIGGNLQGLVDQAINNGYTDAEFLYFLRKTPEYRERFKGIFDKDGKMVMTETEYITFERDLAQLGKQYGYNVTPVDVGQAVRKGFDADSYEERLMALQRIREYEPALRAFMETARAQGLNAPKNPTKRELFDFVTGKADHAFYKLWEEAAAQTAAESAGLNIIDKGERGPAAGPHNPNQYDSMNRSLLRHIIRVLPGQQSEGDLAQPLSEAADEFLQRLPEAKIQSLGLSKKDIITARFGGPNAAAIRKRIEFISKNAEANANNELAQSASYVGQGGGLTVAGANLQRKATE